ncbi:hypothetical protein, partial [Klebsiella pneumoniae]|uniref:hypothetical protein n=1 Tax=Klebsiella pneumoniae TaxID=573 RepID=UPI001D0D89A9
CKNCSVFSVYAAILLPFLSFIFLVFLRLSVFCAPFRHCFCLWAGFRHQALALPHLCLAVFYLPSLNSFFQL